MPSPIRPSQIKDLIPSATGSFCEKFIKILRLPALFYQIYLWWYYEDGSFTEDFKAEICLMRCVCAGLCPGGGGPSPPGTTDIPKPLNLQATDGTVALKVVLTWDSVVGAESYEIWRSDSGNVLGLAFRIGTSSTPNFDDAQVTVGKVYWYWVRAKKGVLFSVYSDPDTGFSQPNLVNGFVYFDKGGTYNFIVPAGVTGIIFDGIGGGAGGGGAAWSRAAGGVLQNAGSGGGGGGGGRNTTAPITVVPTEQLTVIVGAGGAGGNFGRSVNGTLVGGQPGQNGGFSQLFRSGSVSLASANSGKAGIGGAAGYADGVPAAGPGGAGGTGTATGTPGGDGQIGTTGVAHGGSGGPGAGGAIGAGGNGGSSGPGGIMYSAISGRDGAVKLSW